MLERKVKSPVITRCVYQLIPESLVGRGNRELLLANAQDFLISEIQFHFSQRAANPK